MSYSAKNIKTVAIAGAGTMGAGIAYLFAKAGFITILFDIADEQLNKAENNITNILKGALEKGKITESEVGETLSRIGYTNEVRSLTADLILEAIVEKLDPKIDFFKKVTAVNNADAILATNTSSIPVTRIAAALPHPERLVGMHFFNPAHIMKLVEVISGAATHPDVAQTIYDLSLQLGKTPVMAQDAPGFIVNRVARHYYVEGLKVLEENVASFETIDELMEASGFKMGPFRLMDLIGVDTNFNVTSSMFESFHKDAKFRPSRIQQQKVDAGHWGKKTGKGFYEY
jgi:3-hydroxybutyryl-CoA dehydrogenase